jgi:hypothetical protein
MRISMPRLIGNDQGICRSPEPDLVISYAYLWHHEHEPGRKLVALIRVA